MKYTLLIIIMQMRISAISQKALKLWQWDYNNIEFIEFLEFSAILELIDSIILILLSIFPFTLKIYENNYYAINMKSRSLFNLNFLKPYTRHW